MSSNFEAKRQWVQVAHVWRPRGNKGEVAAELLTDYPDRFCSLQRVYLSKNGAEPEPRGLVRFWIDRNHPGQGIFHFAGSASISDAETLRGYDVFLPFEERVVLAAGQYFVTDLIGCTVFEIAGEESRLASPACGMASVPQVLGVVRGVSFSGEGVLGTPLLELETAQGELLVPLAEDICKRIDVAGRRIEVELPGGLKELNAPER